MKTNITGLHHVTAMTSDAQENLDFYAGILGLRMVKKTVNFDATDVYHFYYGNRNGDPGTLLTFFPYPGMPRGRKGNGQVTVTSFSIPENSINYWKKRLSRFNVNFEEPEERFNETVIYFEDHEGLGLELVATAGDDRDGFTYGNIPEEYSIRGFYGVTLSEEIPDRTMHLLTSQMDHALVAEKGNRFRFGAQGGWGYTDILHRPEADRGRGGAGTIHHVAYATYDDVSHIRFRETLLSGGMVSPTPVIDRQYFHSIYFREPGGVLFEAATSDIGMTLDETVEELGGSLRLPRWEEKNRRAIENQLTPVELRVEKFSDAQVQHS
jgi:glyoxalase family protein